MGTRGGKGNRRDLKVRERDGGREKEYKIYTSRNNNLQPPWSYITDKQTETDTYKVASQV